MKLMHWWSFPLVLAIAVVTAPFDRDDGEEDAEAFPWER
jgi:hypothetical protein